MFVERPHDGGLVTLHSPLLDAAGVPHGFTTAAGGLHIGTAAHLSPVLAALGLQSRRVVMTRQVHGCAVTVPGTRDAQADAHATDDAGELVAVRTADCVPVLLSSADGRHVAAVHAGWRGLLQPGDPGVEGGVLGHACETLRAEFGVRPAGLLAAIGPCISADRYEVGEEFRELVRKSGHSRHLRADDRAKPRIELRAIAHDQLHQIGLPLERIEVAPHCTFRDADRFHSYRRQGRGCGHMAAFIGPAA